MSALLLAATLAVGTTQPSTFAPPTTQMSAQETAESRKRYMRILVLPGAALGGGVAVAVVLLSNRARQRRLEREGE